MITPEQRLARRKYLGSSDMAALVGLDPWRTPSDIYLEKTAELMEEEEKEDVLWQEIGNEFESACIRLFSKVRSVNVTKNLSLHHGHYGSNLDGLIEDVNELVEVKTGGDPEDYGDEYTDDVPERHFIQTHEAMHVVSKVTGKECRVAWLPVLLPRYRGFLFKIFRIERNDQLMQDIIKVGDNFWNQNVIPRIPPQPFDPQYSLLKRIKRVPDNIADIPDSLVDDWRAAVDAHSLTDKELKESKRRVIAALGNAEAGETPEGKFVTYYRQSRGAYSVEASEYPVLRMPKKKKAKKR